MEGEKIMVSNLQKMKALINTLTPDEKKLIYKKINEELNGRLLDFIDTTTTAPRWMDS